jgi:hypothetical protein
MIDIAPTIATLLGLVIPHPQGSPLGFGQPAANVQH